MQWVQVLLVAFGMGINFGLYGIGSWSGSVILGSGLLLGSTAQDFVEIYTWASNIGIFCGCLARVAISVWKGGDNCFCLQTTLWSTVLAALLLLSDLWTKNIIVLCVAAFSVGWSFACLSIYWIVETYGFFDKAAFIFFVSLLVASFSNLLYACSPTNWLSVFLGVGLLLSFFCVVLSCFLRKRLVDDSRSSAANETLAKESGRYLSAFKRFAGVILCVIALQIIAPTVNYMGLTSTLEPDRQLMIVSAAQAIAAFLVLLFLKIFQKSFYTVQVFKFVTPILILLLFFLPFAGEPYSLVVLLVGSCMYFVVVVSLFAVDAMAITKENDLVFECFYGTGFLVTTVVTAMLDEIMPLLLSTANSTELLVAFGVFFCIYILSMAFVYVQGTSPKASDAKADKLHGEESIQESGTARGQEGFVGRNLSLKDSHDEDLPNSEVCEPCSFPDFENSGGCERESPPADSSQEVAEEAEAVSAKAADLMNVKTLAQESTAQASKPICFSHEDVLYLQKSYQLSDREVEVLELLLRGKNVPAIAEELFISQNTVRSHVKRIYRALNVHSRQELISCCESDVASRNNLSDS